LTAILLEPVVEKQIPLIDLDWTVLVQFGLFLVMLAVLWTLVWKPFLAVQEERSRRIDGAKVDARGMQERATAIIADYEDKLVRAKQRGAEERIKLRAEGQAYERDVLGSAREVGQKALDAARQKSEAEREVARKILAADAQLIGQRVATRILGREV
jgi:F-type H+-transporting ATPase subunit b